MIEKTEQKSTKDFYDVIVVFATLIVIFGLYELVGGDWLLWIVGFFLVGFTGYNYYLGWSTSKLLSELSLQQILTIESWGFEIEEPDLNQQISWSEIERVDLTLEPKKVMTFLRKSQEPLLIKEDENVDWYKLLMRLDEFIPVSQEIKIFKEGVLRDSEVCKVCGYKSLVNEECLSCFHEVYNEDLGDVYESEAAYIKEEQLELFSTNDPGEMIRLSFDEETGFEKDTYWKPIVTIEEVKQYSKENYWD